MRAHHLAITALFASLLACVDDDNSRPGDTIERADAAPPDAAPPVPVEREGIWYVMDSIQVPESQQDAVDLGLDLDRDGRPDNALGGLLAAMQGSANLTTAGPQLAAIEDGRLLQLVGIDAPSLEDLDPVPVLIARGVDLDGDPSDNFSGEEGFALDPLEGADGLLEGALVEGRLRAGSGTIPIQLAMFGVTPEVIALRGVGARIRVLAAADGLTEGRFCGALTEAEVDAVLIPAMAVGVDSVVRRDCPGGPCTPGTQGEELSSFFDENQDGMVPEEEFSANSLIQSTVGNPDLDLFDADGVFNPRTDGIKDALSFCLGFTAVGARAYE